MSLFQQLNDDVKAAMKSGDKTKLEVLRFSLASLNSAQKEKALKEPGATLTDDEVIANLQKEAKRRKEAIELFKQGNRN
ncbi:MAG TPA: GatB/YqeY domain-containing protein, partial [Candidatus Paceibacterota bacterium]|nr:GatB/YqeY domain-containing protein [Candidatus Paceibacterota bacterium]